MQGPKNLTESLNSGLIYPLAWTMLHFQITTSFSYKTTPIEESVDVILCLG